MWRNSLLIALFSLLLVSCTTATTYTTQLCPAPLTSKGCAQWLEAEGK